jgi:hypothetical protein
VHFGSDGRSFYVRMDFRSGFEQELAGMEARLTLESLNGAKPRHLTIEFSKGARIVEALDPPGEAVLGQVLEVRIPLAALGVCTGGGLRFQCSLWQGGLPIDAVPQQGWIAMATTDPLEMAY